MSVAEAPDRRVRRLYLGHLDHGPVAPVLPIHGYAVEAGDDLVLVDTGIGPRALGRMNAYCADWKMTVRTLDEALGDHGLSVSDVTRVVSTHLHLDHYGQHLALAGVPFVVQRAELALAKAGTPVLGEFFAFADAVIYEMDGDEEIADGVRVLATPGHTVGHQSLLVTNDDGSTDLLAGDAAYTRAIWDNPETMADGHPAYHMQVGDPEHWSSTLERLKGLGASRVHFCHDPAVAAGAVAA